MGLRINFNPRMLELTLEQIGERAVKGMSDRMRRVAVRIRDLARDNAPFLTGDLEKAIEYMTIRQGGRNAYVVFVDVDAVRSAGAGQVGDYAWIMEEELHPYGRVKGERRYNLGARSAAKAAGGKKVGGRFLARAVRAGTKNLEAEMAAVVARTRGVRRTVNLDYSREIDEEE